MHQQLYGELLHNATTLWAESGQWRPGKWATIAALRMIARTPTFHVAVAQKVAARKPVVAGVGDDPPILTLRELVIMVFELVLAIYGPTLPFQGYWVRVALEFVLEHLDNLFVPKGLEAVARV